jgi:twitching motility protein PilI
LRRLQTHLADRLQAVRARPTDASWLAVECAGRGLLLPLAEAGEIFAMTALLPVAHTRPWFLGVANLRGGLHGVVDLAAFLDFGRPDRGHDDARLLAFNAALDINCALLVDRLAGLRSAAELTATAAAAQPQPRFVGSGFRDEAGRHWQELRLSALARDEAFLAIVAEPGRLTPA